MIRMTSWYFVGVACVLGLLAAMGITAFVTVFIFQHHLTWDWLLQLAGGVPTVLA